MRFETLRDRYRRYADWLHLRFPAGTVEKLPRVDEHFRTSVPGVYVVGDLAGVPLLKFSLDGGARVAQSIAEHRAGGGDGRDGVLDVVILGAGAAGMAAAREAERLGLAFEVVEAREPFATIRDFQRGKPIYTYPHNMEPTGTLAVTADVKEALVDELEAQTADLPVRRARADRIERSDGVLTVHLDDEAPVQARHVIVAIGRSGDYRTLGVPGERADHVHHRLHDPADHAGRDVLVVGGGDAAVEAAIALAEAGARVTVSYRRDAFVRPKPENVERIERLARQGAPAGGRLRVAFESEVHRITDDHAVLATPDGERKVPADAVFVLIGREAPLDFFRRSGIALRDDWGQVEETGLRRAWRERSLAAVRWSRLDRLNLRRVAALTAFVLFMAAVYSWTKGGWLNEWAGAAEVWPFTLLDDARALPDASLGAVLLRSASTPAFYYTLVYSLIVVVFGIRRVRRRRTPYVRVQTATLAAIQVLPLFILPEILLPYLGGNGLLPAGVLDALFPVSEWSVHGREYWRAYGFILAWPLLVYNVFTSEPLLWWLLICFVQTFVLIPGMIYFWGKGAYCGWICSCGALAETLGDTHRDKMPHGPGWNRFNMAGQWILGVAVVILVLRVAGWLLPGGWIDGAFNALMYAEVAGVRFGYAWTVDVLLAGTIGYGVYFWLSGRFWCRFLCPLAALMHVYTRFSRFRILAEKEKCISCNVCTSVCHQGIDVMAFAQRGLPMDDPQCVRCSACVQSCPTAVLSFGQVDRSGVVISRDALEASLTRLMERDEPVPERTVHRREKAREDRL